MKRLIISIAAFCLVVCASNAQKIHFICFADTNDPKIGSGVKQNVNLMTCFVMQLAAGLNMENDIEPLIVMQGNDCNNRNLHSVIQGFQCSSEDIVIFSYFGHGGRGVNDQSDFPQMCLGSNNQSEFVPLEFVKDALSQKGPKFLIVLGDCCNSYSEYILPKTNTLVTAGPTMLSLRTTNALKKMFMDNYGSVISSGCKKGEYSWVNSIEGGFFTNGLLKGLDEYVNTSNASYTWEELLTNVQGWVVNYSRLALANHGGYIQTPIFAVDHNPNPKGVSRPDSGKSVDLRTTLISICNKFTNASERLNRSEKALHSYFASEESVIDVVGLDQRTIVEHTSASDYLLRLATVEHLANFNIVEQQKNPFGKITYLKIHEIYRED